MSLFCKGSDAGDGSILQEGENFVQKGGFPDAPTAGEEQVALTRQMKKSDDRSGGWPRRIGPDRLHSVSAAPFPRE